MSNIGSYEEKVKNFKWDDCEAELGYKKGDIINIGEYCTDRICRMGKGEKPALFWQGYTGEIKKYTFNRMRVLTNTIARYLKDLGIKEGERVCLFLDKVPELYFGFLGILKMGAIAQPLFSAFGGESLFTRLEDAEATAIITQKKHVGKVRKILNDLPRLKHVIIVDDDGSKPLRQRETAFSMETAASVEDFEIFPSTAETPSVLHYTSGTTGKPKGAQHVHYSLISQYITAKYVLDLTDEDIYWCTADPGWVTGTSYGIIGPWSNGITQCVLDSGFRADTWYQFIEDHKITTWYSAPTAIRSLMREGKELVQQYDLSSLRHMCSVGEPLNAEAVIWSGETFGLSFHDTFWQTETGSIMICNYPGMKIKPGSMGKPFPGITADVVDMKTYEPVKKSGTVGLIAIIPGWPSMFRSYWKNEEVYRSKFRNGWYICGDRASIDEDGYFWFVGRDDDVINTGGHLVGPFEIESALLEHEAVAESACVGKPDPVNMEVVKAFIALKPGYKGSDELELKIMNFIRKKLSPLAMPQEIEFMDSLPKTRSGKIMRRLLRAKEWGEEIGDTSTLEDNE
ncbi:MAG: acetate--CoA ligase [Candidatus Aminicenantes bacterium]|nr:acetate--CoA ligase [Candidatus Aminicenantes bacterium]NIM81699.1 acetate--CoA ligase [Candidatus Aminicenantes bacterium]NIN21070.1 acetate--CoA ligase [Candidatus Aminicenantes bacterium]NIN44892.1 acetate--CoA ligase [Candidatus Aminicenantes bacterium]NIN87706.1 acetate--CoA ligase [Candidatus Aminicenantes bacterium]